MKNNQRQQILAHDRQTKSIPLSARLPRSGLRHWDSRKPEGKACLPTPFRWGSEGGGGLWLVAPIHIFLLYDSSPAPFHHPSNNKTRPGLGLASVTQAVLPRPSHTQGRLAALCSSQGWWPAALGPSLAHRGLVTGGCPISKQSLGPFSSSAQIPNFTS